MGLSQNLACCFCQPQDQVVTVEKAKSYLLPFVIELAAIYSNEILKKLLCKNLNKLQLIKTKTRSDHDII